MEWRPQLHWFFVILFLSAVPMHAEAAGPLWTLSGTEIHDASGAPVRLRGFNVCWWVPPTDLDAAALQALGVNGVRYMFGYEPKGTYDPSQISEVERQVRYFTSRGICVIPVLYEFEKPDPADPRKKLGPWSTPEMNREFLALWTDIMTRLGSEARVAAWEPLNEPHDVDPQVASAWYRDLLPKLRKIDSARPIVVEGANYSHAEDLTDMFKMDDPNIIYAFHMYDPYNYTTDIQKPPLEYPGTWGKDYLAKKIEPALNFRAKYHVPVWCGEWGSKTAAPGYDRWMKDMFALLEENKLDWCVWAWALQPKDPQNDSFDINLQKKDVYALVKDFFRQTHQLPASPSATTDHD